MAVTRTESARSGLRWGGIAGIVFAVAFVVGILLSTDTPDGDESDRKWIDYFADSGNRRMIIIGVFVLGFAALAFIVFLGVLRERLRDASPGAEWVSTVAFASGIAFVALLGVAGAGLASVAAGISIADNPVPRDADLLRNVSGIGYGALLVFGMVAAGLLMVTTSAAAGRAALLPRWLVVSGYVAGVIVIVGGVLFIPMVLFVLWMLIVGIVMLTRSRAVA
jgi:MFS family permease